MNNYNSGWAIRKLRIDKGLTQQDFADKIGVSRQAVIDWEMGNKNPETASLLSIHEKFDVSIDYILGLSKYTTCENDLIGKVTGLSDTAIEELKNERAAGFGEIETLNAILSSDGCNELWQGIAYYIDPKDKPCVLMYDKEKEEPILKPIDTIILGNNDIAHDMVLDETFLEMVAKEHVNKALEQIKRDNKGR